MMEAPDGTSIGELILVKEEDIQVKEEELEKEHDIFFNQMEEIHNQGEKRPLSPSFHEKLQSSKRQCSNVEESRTSSTGSTHCPSNSEYPRGERTWGTARLSVQARQMVMNVYQYFRSRCQQMCEADIHIRVADATGVSVSTVQRIKKLAKDGKLDEPPSLHRNRAAPVMDSIDDLVQGSLRTIALSFYERNKIPTLDAIFQVVKGPPVDFQGGRTSLTKILKKMGFRYLRVDGGRQILVEKDDTVASRWKLLRALSDNRKSSSPRTEVYIDETLVSKEELVGTTGAKLKKDLKYIIVHAGGEKGFVPGAFLVFRPQVTDKGHLTNAMTMLRFERWFKKQLIPNIPNNSLIVMDSASCHSKPSSKVPNRSMKTSCVIQWLKENDISHDRTASKSELLQLVNSNKEKLTYEIDQVAHDFGHEVLRLPPHHNHLNPMELIWQQVKSNIKSKSSEADQNLHTPEELIKDAVGSVTEKEWRMCINRTREIEEEYKKKDKAVDRMLEKFTVSWDELSTDEED